MSRYITERRLHDMFARRGFRVNATRRNSHWWAWIARVAAAQHSPVAVSQTPSDRRFERQFDKSLRQAERAAISRNGNGR